MSRKEIIFYWIEKAEDEVRCRWLYVMNTVLYV